MSFVRRLRDGTNVNGLANDSVEEGQHRAFSDPTGYNLELSPLVNGTKGQ